MPTGQQKEQEAPTAPLPLLRGREGFPCQPFAPHTTIGMLVVASEPHEQDGLLVQRCLCGCNRSCCAEQADVDVRYLHDETNFVSGECVLRGPAFFPPFDELRAAAARRRVTTTEQYRQAYVRGYLPKAAPMDPTEYPEWTSWSDFTGQAAYQSERELFDGLLALDLNSLGLLPKPERRRVLLLSRHWSGIKKKAAEMGIPEAQIPGRLGEIVAALEAAATDRPGRGDGSGAGNSSARTGSTMAAQKLTLADQAKVLVSSVTTWLPSSAEMQREIINGFYHSVWELLDRHDTLDGNGYQTVQDTVLELLAEVKPALVTEFIRQHDGVLRHKRDSRNWMQAYSLWHAESHKRFINWSSAGLGKTRTIPALVHMHDIRLTILFSPKAISNEHNPQLATELLIEDPRAALHYSDNGVPAHLDPSRHHYFICNPEKLQQEAKTRAMVDAMLRLRPCLLVFDEAHLLVSSDLVNPETGETEADTKYKPRMSGLRYLLDHYDPEQRIVLLTGTPVRTNSREGQALFELIGENIGEFTGEMSEINALRLRGKLQEFGFHFLNYRLPELRRFIYPFRVDDALALRLNAPGISPAAKEKLRIEQALELVWNLRGKTVINAERVALTAEEAEAPTENTDASAFENLSPTRFPVIRLLYEPMNQAVNPVLFTMFVDGPVEAISRHLKARRMQYRVCTGESDRAELGAYLTERNSCLIASSSWSVGVDGSQKVSNTLLTLGIPWHDSGHRQTVARLHRQGACTPDDMPTTVIHEIIPVAVNVGYDVKRLNTVYARRSFGEVLSAGEVEGDDNGSGANRSGGYDECLGEAPFLCGEDCIPDCRRSLVFEVQAPQ